MAKTKVSEWSTTPSSNTDIDGINIAEGCAPSGINDAIRDMMAQIRSWQSGTYGDTFNGPVNGTVGATTPATGAFTALSASSTVTLSGGTANGVTYLNGSKVLTSGSALTFDGTNLLVGSGTAVSLSGYTMLSQAKGSFGIVSGNDEFAGAILRESSSTNSISIQADPANLRASSFLGFGVDGSEGMRLTSTGLGIGTSSPSGLLTLNKSSGAYSLNLDGGGYGTLAKFGVVNVGTDNSSYIGTISNNNFLIKTYNSTVATFDTSGNLGLGVTPSAWVTLKGFEIGGLGNSISGYPADAGIYVSSNAYYGTGGWKYAYSSKASTLYTGEGGLHSWKIAPSGTAGNAITFTQAMTLDASGGLQLGVTSSDAKLYVTNGASPASRIIVGGGGGAANTLYTVLSGGNNIQFETNGSERARIDSSGNLLVGTTSAASSTKLDVVSSAGGVACIGSKVTGGATTQCYVAWNASTTGDAVFHQFYTESSATLRGSITYNRGAGLTAYNTTSDYRAKDIIGPVTDSGSLIDSVPVYIGKIKGATQERPMFIAHETPSYAHTGEKDAVDEDGNPVYQQMDASALIPVMWAEIQSLRKRLADAGL